MRGSGPSRGLAWRTDRRIYRPRRQAAWGKRSSGKAPRSWGVSNFTCSPISSSGRWSLPERCDRLQMFLSSGRLMATTMAAFVLPRAETGTRFCVVGSSSYEGPKNNAFGWPPRDFGVSLKNSDPKPNGARAEVLHPRLALQLDRRFVIRSDTVGVPLLRRIVRKTNRLECDGKRHTPMTETAGSTAACAAS